MINLKLITNNDSNSVYVISDITVVCLNSTTQQSVVCVISIILYKYLNECFDTKNCVLPQALVGALPREYCFTSKVKLI